MHHIGLQQSILAQYGYMPWDEEWVKNPPVPGSGAGAGKTDLLITWLYRLTVTNNDYKRAAVIGIMVFLVVAVISLIVYNLMPSIKSEEEFQ